MHCLVGRGGRQEKKKERRREREGGLTGDCQGARLRPATPSPSAPSDGHAAEGSQDETSVATTPGTVDVTPGSDEEQEMDPGVHWSDGAKAPPVALQQMWCPAPKATPVADATWRQGQ